MEIGPTLSAIRRNKTGPILICLQIALTLALVVNSIFLINLELEKIAKPLGTDVENTAVFNVALVDPLENMEPFVKNDLNEIRHIPGIIDATVVSQPLHTGGGNGGGFRPVPELDSDLSKGVSINEIDEHGLNTLGIELLYGRNFRTDEILYPLVNSQAETAEVALITESLAQSLFPDIAVAEVVGKMIYQGDSGADPIEVIGIISDVAAHWVNYANEFAQATPYHYLFFPMVQTWYGEGHYYMFRTEPGKQDRLMAAVTDKLYEINPDRLFWEPSTQGEIVRTSQEGYRAMATILSIISVLMILITAFGIVGLASFTVNQRTRQIGTRRALGAKKRDILRYFLVENIMLTTIGVVLGSAMAYGIHLYLFSIMFIPKMSLTLIPVGVAALYLLGIAAVIGPAVRATAVPPAVASRAV
ncbi:MAG: ABC transporter permease [Woeseiaceae bacterium]